MLPTDRSWLANIKSLEKTCVWRSHSISNMIGSAETISTHLYRYHDISVIKRHRSKSFSSFERSSERGNTTEFLLLILPVRSNEDLYMPCYSFPCSSFCKRFQHWRTCQEILPSRTQIIIAWNDKLRIPRRTSSLNSFSEWRVDKVLGSLWAILWEAGCAGIFNGKQSETKSYFEENRETNCSLGYFNRLNRGF